ncbi:cysteinyl leukotriene receptor 1-like [Stegostoma tigrinum]|uniref:cysteinyl leukotriene receptor 1-like n=1 Tax=Stegostoma tigrinum TaxID=3053191 RepID=UPI0028705CEC|nr:cysteinyl leukotriene receptor 1-like [Stegostoma tigrinum]
MATADLLVIVTEVVLNRIDDYYFPLNFLKITPVCSVRYVLLRAATDCSVWFTVAFTFDRCIAICYPKLKSKYCTKKAATAILLITGILLCLKNIPIYFRFKPRRIINNIPWRCSNKPSYFTDSRWIGFRKFEKILTPLIPFGLILFLNGVTVSNILLVSRIRKRLKCNSKRDSETESRRKSIILLFTISGSFILLWFIYVLHFFDVDDLLDDQSAYKWENNDVKMKDYERGCSFCLLLLLRETVKYFWGPLGGDARRSRCVNRKTNTDGFVFEKNKVIRKENLANVRE